MGTIFVDKIKNGAGGATVQVDEIVNVSGDNDSGIDLSTNDNIKFDIAGSQKAMFDSSGNLLVAKTSSSGSNSGVELRATGRVFGTSDGATPLFLNRLSDEGSIATFRKDGSEIGTLGVSSNKFQVNSTSGSNLLLATDGTNRVAIDSVRLYPNTDDNYDLGLSSIRFDDIFATNGTIQTSDQNEKQDIASATTKELNVAKKLSTLFKTFRWKSKVTEKGDKARTHSGIIAQDIQAAFSAEGLDASKYGLFTSDTWWEKDKETYETKEEAPEDATERTRLGVRYPELFSFIFSSIEARLTALESK